MHPKEKELKPELLALTGLRFFAAFWVFLFHIHIRWSLTEFRFLKNVLSQGAVGMSIFFSLSGYVLAYRYWDTKVSVRNYLTNRFARIYPIYAMTAILTLPWLGIPLSYTSYPALLKSILKTFFIFFSNIFLIQA
jgi:peptidoglycan/LPS O-acetylase OafA/YrhL